VNATLVAAFFLVGADTGATADGFTVAVGGDVSLARCIAGRAISEGWDRVLAPLRDALAGADARIVNLESATGTCVSAGSVQRPRLCGDFAALASLVQSSITAVTLANNHALDAGESGLAATVGALRAENVVVLGATSVRTGKPVAEPLGPLAVIAANLSHPAWPPGRAVPIPTPDDVGASVRAARQAAPRRPVLVILHGGREMDPAPSSFEWMYARSAVDAGAAAVVFHGAHVARSVETVAGVPVHLGLGNLLFDQRAPGAARGQVLVLRFRPGEPAEIVEVRCLEAMTALRCQCPNGTVQR
jgi:poly-gamma-glutamate synthesis protein (capsule biosynthesis protein)